MKQITMDYEAYAKELELHGIKNWKEGRSLLVSDLINALKREEFDSSGWDIFEDDCRQPNNRLLLNLLAELKGVPIPTEKP